MRVEVAAGATEEEAAAIVVALEALWPRPVAALAETKRTPAWQFSGRWWHRDRMAHTDRPWR